MIRIRMAGLVVGIESRYDFSHRIKGFETDAEPDFTVAVGPEEIEQERQFGAQMPDSYLEFVCAYRRIAERLPEYDAFVMHGAAVSLDHEAAYLFTAPSGTGKTTHVRLWQLRFWGRTEILNGDKPILRRIGGVWHACGTPWRGKENMGGSDILPLKGISMLHRSAENRVQRVDAGSALPALMNQLYLPKNENSLLQFVELLNDCINQVPIYDLNCDRSSRAPVASYEAMTGRPAGEEPKILAALAARLHEFDDEKGIKNC